MSKVKWQYRKFRSWFRRFFGLNIPNRKDYPVWRLIRRAWIQFTCTHWNAQYEWSDGQGHNILVCTRCQRATIYADCHRPVNIE